MVHQFVMNEARVRSPQRERQSTACSVAARNEIRRRALMWQPGHPFPLPPCLAGDVGRSRYADRLRPFYKMLKYLVFLFAIDREGRIRDI